MSQCVLLLFSFSDLSAHLIALFLPQLFRHGIPRKYAIVFYPLAHHVLKPWMMLKRWNWGPTGLCLYGKD